MIPIVVTLVGMVTDDRAVHPTKAPATDNRVRVMIVGDDLGLA